jgi:hypothetical protein
MIRFFFDFLPQKQSLQSKSLSGIIFTHLKIQVKMGDLAVYWDRPPAVPIPDSKGDDFWIGFLHASEFSTSRPDHHYLLKPCSPSALVSKNDFPTLDSPRWEFALKLEGVHLGLTQVQFQDVTSVHLALESRIVK